MRVEHRYVKAGLYTPENATSLLIGTFPSVLVREAFGRVRQTDVDFFYGSADNNFWKDLGIVYNRDFLFTRTREAIMQRTELLDCLQLGLSDAIYACHTSGSATDTALQDIELNNHLIDTLDNHPLITTLYFTSSSGKVNAETLTLRLLQDQGRSSGMKIVQERGPRLRAFHFKDKAGKPRVIETITLYSPSPLAEQWGTLTPESRRDQYKTWLPKL